MSSIESLQAVLDFWFDSATRARWFKGGQALDDTIRRQFGALHRAAGDAQLADWRDTPCSRLAEILVLDQFSRHIHRGRAAAFANDARALCCAREAVAAGADRELSGHARAFIYMPYMHSESLADHADAQRLFDALGIASHIKAEHQHAVILERFGRYPHRNAALGRIDTPEEQSWLAQHGNMF